MSPCMVGTGLRGVIGKIRGVEGSSTIPQQDFYPPANSWPWHSNPSESIFPSLLCSLLFNVHQK